MRLHTPTSWCRATSGGRSTDRWLKPAGCFARTSALPDLKWAPVEFSGLADPALRPFTRGHDVFGDASLVILPTPGHTPGSMSMFVRRTDGPALLLAGDLTYDFDAFERNMSGGVGSRRHLRKTRNNVLGLRAKNLGMPILAAHDPAAAGLLDAALTEDGRRLASDITI